MWHMMTRPRTRSKDSQTIDTTNIEMNFAIYKSKMNTLEDSVNNDLSLCNHTESAKKRNSNKKDISIPQDDSSSSRVKTKKKKLKKQDKKEVPMNTSSNLDDTPSVKVKKRGRKKKNLEGDEINTSSNLDTSSTFDDTPSVKVERRGRKKKNLEGDEINTSSNLDTSSTFDDTPSVKVKRGGRKKKNLEGDEVNTFSNLDTSSNIDDTPSVKVERRGRKKRNLEGDEVNTFSNLDTSSNFDDTPSVKVERRGRKKKNGNKVNTPINVDTSSNLDSPSISKQQNIKKTKVTNKKQKFELIDLDNVMVVLTDCERESLFQKQLKNIKIEPIDTDIDVPVQVERNNVENIMGRDMDDNVVVAKHFNDKSNEETDQDNDKPNEVIKHVNDKPNEYIEHDNDKPMEETKHDNDKPMEENIHVPNKLAKETKYSKKKHAKESKQNDEKKALEEYKRYLLAKIEAETSTSQVQCSPMESTPNSNRTSVSLTVETHNTPFNDNNDSASVRIENNDISFEVSIDSSNQCVYADKKKQKISTNITKSITEEYYSTQDESVDDSTDLQNELNNQMVSVKRKRKDRKYRKKNKGKNSKLLPSVSNKLDDSAVSLQDDLKTLDIVEKMEEEIVPEKLRYIPIDLNDNFYGILILSQNQMVAMKGCMQLNVVYGEVDVSGYKMVAGQVSSPPVDVFSVTTSSLFYIRDISPTPCSVESKEKLLTDLATSFESTKENMAELLGDISEVFACVIVKKLYSLLPALLKKLNNFNGFTKEPKFLSKPFKSGVLDTSHWEDLLTGIQNEMAVKKDDCICSTMVCGAGNVGKSSLARYSINRMLEKHDAVFCLDCDCGQSEFTPPSVLSLVKVTKPLLGLPFSHQSTPVSSYFYGHISPGDTPSEYIKLIGYLFQTYYVDYYYEGPLVINTQGWMQGLGLSLLMDCIRLISPCHIIHISGPNTKSNIPTQLNEEFIENEDGWDIDTNYKCIKMGHGCKYHNLSITDVQKKFKAGNKSRISRDQCITSYFSRLYQPYLDQSLKDGEKYIDWIPPSICVIMPFIVRWEDVALHIMHEKVSPDVMLFGFNLSLVGLARVEPELIKTAEDASSEDPNYLSDQPVAEYIGFGIIRNIDPTKKLFYILTPEPAEKLKNVNALLRGSAHLPNSFFLEDIHSNQPYYCTDYITVASKTAAGMKPRYNLKRKPSKMRPNVD